MILISVIQILFVVISTGISALLAALGLLVSRELSFWIAKNIWAKSVCFFVRCKIQVFGKEIISTTNSPVIFCANHLSNFDIIAIYRSVDRPIYFIAKKELSKIPFLGWYMKAAGMIFIDRTNHEKAIISMREAGELIKKGRNVITFPEGTRSKNGNIGKFKKGSFLIAYNDKIPIIPIAIKNSNKINPDNSLRIYKSTVRVNIGNIINDYSKFNSPEELSDYTKNEVKKLLKGI